jgi:hypothetical protein
MEKREEFIEDISTEKYKHQIDIWYRAYNIHREKIELFYDFLSTLYNLVDTTFLGVDVLYNENDQRNHFIWCWNKLITDFGKERIYFKEKGNHYEYFWNFFSEAYYLVKMEEETPRINDYFEKLFDFRHRKTRSELDIVTELYKLLEQNLKK